MSSTFTKNQYAIRSLWFYRRLALAVALGVSTAATVITGALIVGDSMRGSLRALTVDRLGKIDQIIIPGGFFQTEGIPQEIDSRTVSAVILFDRGVVETAAVAGQPIRRASSVQILGVDDSYSTLDTNGFLPNEPIGESDVVLNRAAADELGVEVGDQVTVRLPSEQAVPADSPLGKRDSQTEGIPRLNVKAIVENRGLGRFAMHPSQVEPMTALLNRETIAKTLDRAGQANSLFVSVPLKVESNGEDWMDSLPLRLSDFGVKLTRVTKEFKPGNTPEETVLDYYQVSSDRLLLPEAASKRLVDEFKGDYAPQVAMTYLANSIERLDVDGKVTASVPYSIISAIDSSKSLPLEYGGAVDDVSPIVINNWTADALKASVGDRLRVLYYEPEVEGGREIERSFDAVLTSIVPITKPSKPYVRNRPNQFETKPTVYNDPDLTPSVPGVTDQDSISDWELPFKLDREISSDDDRYWAEHRLTPKAFIPLAKGQQLFGSRFGDTTSLRFPGSTAANTDELGAKIRQSLLPIRDKLGWAPIMIRQSQLAASRGTTPFDALFLSLSFFVIIAAVMLISLLYRLGMIQRSREYGLLMASGWSGKDVSRIAIREGLWSSVPGVLFGLLGGVGYAWLVLAALRSWWVGAVTVPFLEFHARPTSFLIGGVSTIAVTLITIWSTARRLRRSTAQALLAGRVESSELLTTVDKQKMGRKVQIKIAAGLTVSAIVALIVGGMGNGLAQAGAFVGAGMLLLAAALLFIHHRLSMPPMRNAAHDGNYTLFKLASGNLRRNPLRSTLAIGLMAVATFLIVSIGSFQLRPTASGVGGFALLGRTATPLYRDLNDRTVQSELLGQDRDSIPGTQIVSMRFKSGQDASCNNLYQASQPQVFAVPMSMSKETGRVPFDWAKVETNVLSGENASPWKLLETKASGTVDDPIPLVLDQNTAMWSLQMTGGIGQVKSFSWTADQPIYFRVVGLLSNSVLQGSLLIGEKNFERVFPEVSGYEFFMIATDQPKRVEEVLENRLSDVGMDVTESAVVLSRLMAVQNTYLKTFQSLGALGLLLGTVGLAIAQLRSALERQSELAVLRAIGFSKSRIANSIMIEAASLLGIGIGAGLVCSVIAIAPQAIAGQVLPPISEPLIAIGLIAIVGLIAGLVTVTRVVQMPLIESIRN